MPLRGTRCVPGSFGVSPHMRAVAVLMFGLLGLAAVSAQPQFQSDEMFTVSTTTIRLQTTLPSRCMAWVGEPGRPIIVLDIKYLEDRAGTYHLASELLRLTDVRLPQALPCTVINRTEARNIKFVGVFTAALETGDAAVFMDLLGAPVDSVIVRKVDSAIAGDVWYYLPNAKTPFAIRQRWIR